MSEAKRVIRKEFFFFDAKCADLSHEMQPPKSFWWREICYLGLERVELYRVLGRVGRERSGFGSSRVFRFLLWVSGLIRLMNFPSIFNLQRIFSLILPKFVL